MGVRRHNSTDIIEGIVVSWSYGIQKTKVHSHSWRHSCRQLLWSGLQSHCAPQNCQNSAQFHWKKPTQVLKCPDLPGIQLAMILSQVFHEKCCDKVHKILMVKQLSFMFYDTVQLSVRGQQWQVCGHAKEGGRLVGWCMTVFMNFHYWVKNNHLAQWSLNPPPPSSPIPFTQPYVPYPCYGGGSHWHKHQSTILSTHFPHGTYSWRYISPPAHKTDTHSLAHKADTLPSTQSWCPLSAHNPDPHSPSTQSRHPLPITQSSHPLH